MYPIIRIWPQQKLATLCCLFSPFAHKTHSTVVTAAVYERYVCCTTLTLYLAANFQGRLVVKKSCFSRQRFFNDLFTNLHFTHKTCLFSWPFLDIKNKALQLVSGECTGERISFFPFRQYNNNNINNIERRIQVLAFTSLRCRLMHEALACQ